MKKENEEKHPIKEISTKLAKWTLTKRQRELLKLLDEKEIIIITGPAGSSKTWIDCFYALKSYMNHEVEKVIFTKPAEESGEKLGFLPGDINDKIDPHYESFTTNLLKLLKEEKNLLNKLFEKNKFEYRPLAFMRGASWENSLLIGDEFQNADIRQIMLFVTRMGKNSKCIISGDTRQYDINKNSVGLLYFKDMIKDLKEVGTFRFEEEDIMRHEILKKITKRYELAKNKKNLPRNKK